MNTHRKKDKARQKQLFVIVICVLSLAIFEAFFLMNAFENKKREMYMSATRNLLFTHRSISDSLEVKSSKEELSNAMMLLKKVAISVDDENGVVKKSVTRTFKNGKVISDSLITQMPSGTEVKEIYIGSDSAFQFDFQIDSTNFEEFGLNFKKLGVGMEKLQRGFGNMNFKLENSKRNRFDSNLEIDTHLVSSAFRVGYLKDHPYISLRWDVVDTSEAKEGFHRHPFVLSNDASIHVFPKFDGVLKAVLLSVTTEFVFCLLLLALVSFALILFYRNAEQQRKMMALKNELISNISHELKTPVSSVKIALEAIQKRMESSTDNRINNYLEQSNKEINRLQYLIEKVLQSSILEEGQLGLSKNNCSVNTLLQRSIKTVELLAEEKQVRIELPTFDDVTLEIDCTLIERALTHVLENAIKYGPENAIVQVWVKQDEKDVVLEIKDQGKGVPAEYLPAIFDRFFRLPTQNIHNIKGHGLGLHFVKSVIKQHGGSVAAKTYSDGFSIQLKLPKHG